MLSMTKRNEGALAKERKTDEVRTSVPPIDVYENDAEFLVYADLPGVPKDAATVSFEHDRLLLEGAAEQQKFRREVIVPPSVDPDKVSAEMRAGTLTVHLPKRPRYQPRQIPVKTV